MYRELEHPDITRALRTGYPGPVKETICEMCEEGPIDDLYYILDGKKICEQCMIDIAKQELENSPELAAKFIQAERRSD